MENTNENGIVPYTTTGFGGASSAKEAVIQEIASGNAKQNEMNQTVGGRGRGHPVSPDIRGHPVNPDKKRGGKRGGSKRSSRKVGGKHSSKRSSKRSSHKRGGSKSSKKRGGSKSSSSKRSSKRSSHKRSHKRSNKRSSRRKIHGGEPQAGQEVTVPQFQGDPAASQLSGGLNSLMLKSSQDAVHDKDISV